MKIFFALLVLISASIAQANFVEVAVGQQLVDSFLSEHEIASTSIYCRIDITTPECRTLMKFKNKASKMMVKSFQMAFTAPFRQAGGTEFFLETTSKDKYLRWIDGTIDGKVNIDAGGNIEDIQMTKSSILIKGINFGTTKADLRFGENEATLIGEKVNSDNTRTPVNLSYPLFKPTKKSDYFPNGKVFNFSFISNGLRLDIVQDLRTSGSLTTTATCHTTPKITVSVSAPVEITDRLIVNNLAVNSPKKYNTNGEWCMAIIPARQMIYETISEETMQVTNDPLHPNGMQWNVVKP